MKTLLINPPFYRLMGLEQDYIPLGLMSVGAWMEKKEGHDVRIYNMEIHPGQRYLGYNDRMQNFYKHLTIVDSEIWEELQVVILAEEPDQIGFSVLSVKSQTVDKMISYIRINFPEIKIIVGGYHPTITGKKYGSGVGVWDGEYESCLTGGRIKDLDMLPYFNYNQLIDYYSPNGYAHFMSARGCPFSCKFCCSQAMWHRKVTYKSSRRLISEMEIVYDKFKPDLMTIWDETFTMNDTRLYDFCGNYHIPVEWSCDTRADQLNESKIIAMKNAGCKYIGLGIECGHDESLNEIGKNESVKDMLEAAYHLDKHNMKWKAYCIIGFPHETADDIRQTIYMAEILRPFRIVLSFFTPYPGTEYADIAPSEPEWYAHQSPNNYFCKNIPEKEWFELKRDISKRVDEYNKEAIKEWR